MAYAPEIQEPIFPPSLNDLDQPINQFNLLTPLSTRQQRRKICTYQPMMTIPITGALR